MLLPIPGYEGQNLLLLMYLLLAVQLSDIFQYIVGKLLGKTKIAPNVSPLKTVEGLMGGGLSLSAIKRSIGTKDWGYMISGHGGVLDRLDSVVFAAPVFFHLTRFAFVP